MVGRPRWWNAAEFARLVDWVPFDMKDEGITPYDRWVRRLRALRDERDRIIEQANANLRSAVLLALSSGMSVADVQKATELSGTTIRKWAHDEHGGIAGRLVLAPPEQ